MQPLKRELTEWGLSAAERFRADLLPEFRKTVARWRDPRARQLRKRRRAKRVAAGSGVASGVFGLGTFGFVVAEQLDNLVQYTAATGFGGLTVFTGAGAIGAGVRYRRLKRAPLPDPPAEPVSLPPADSSAHDPMKRLREAEQSLYQTLARLRSFEVVGDSVAVTEAQGTADTTAADLRRGADRLLAVEAAAEHAPDSERDKLDGDVRRLRAELDEGVDGYGSLVAAAGRALAASDSPEQQTVLRDATDRLAGLAAGMREIFGENGSSTRDSSGDVTEPGNEGRST